MLRAKTVDDTYSKQTAPGVRSRQLDVLGSSAYWLTGLAYVAAYIVLDWLSDRYEFAPLGITPWNPAPGLSAAFLLRLGPAYVPWLFVASLAAEIVVRGVPSWSYALSAAVFFAAGYGLAAVAVRRWPTRLLPLRRLRDVVTFMVVWATAAAVVAGLQGLAVLIIGHITPRALADLTVRNWAGDFSSILVLTPLLLRPDPWP